MKKNFWQGAVALDADGVVLNGNEQKCWLTLLRHGVHISPDSFTRKAIRASGALTPDQYEEMKEQAYNMWQYAQNFQFLPQARVALLALSLLGIPTVIISRRRQEAASFIERLLWTQGIHGIPVFGIGTVATKEEIAKELGGVRLYTDDDLDQVPTIGRCDNLLLFDQPHNREDVAPAPIRRVRDWDELLDFILQLYGKDLTSPVLPVGERPALKVRAAIFERAAGGGYFMPLQPSSYGQPARLLGTSRWKYRSGGFRQPHCRVARGGAGNRHPGGPSSGAPLPARIRP